MPKYLSFMDMHKKMARASLQRKNRPNFIHQKYIFQLGDISCYQQYFIDDNQLTFKSNTAHHYIVYKFHN